MFYLVVRISLGMEKFLNEPARWKGEEASSNQRHGVKPSEREGGCLSIYCTRCFIQHRMLLPSVFVALQTRPTFSYVYTRHNIFFPPFLSFFFLTSSRHSDMLIVRRARRSWKIPVLARKVSLRTMAAEALMTGSSPHFPCAHNHSCNMRAVKKK